MRFACTVLMLALLLPWALPATARAEDEDPAAPAPAPEPAPEPEPTPEPDPAVPIYTIEYLMPGEDDAPEGWKLRGRGAPEGAPTEKRILALRDACDCGLDEDNFYVETVVFVAGEDRVGVALIDVDEHVWHFRRTLDEAATAGGWKVVELGAKGRLLVVGAGARQGDVVTALTEHVVYRLGRIAMDRVSGAGGRSEEARDAARDYAEAIRSFVPDSGMAHAIVGVIHWLAARVKPGEAPDAAEMRSCEEEWRQALADGVTFPPRGSVLVFCAGEYGGLLLEKKDPAVLEEATRVLALAVEHELEGKNNFRRFGNRYNLACALTRAGKLDEAFDMLEKALKTGKSMPAHMFGPQFTNIRDKDTDMAPLRKDERFARLLDEYAPPGMAKKDEDAKDEKGAKPKGHP